MEGSIRNRTKTRKQQLEESGSKTGEATPIKTAKSNNEMTTSLHETSKIVKSDSVPSEEVRRIIENSLKNIRQNCEELREENRVETEKKLEKLVKQTAEFSQKMKNEVKVAMKDVSSYVTFYNSMWEKLFLPFLRQIREQFTMSSLTDVLFYYLMKDELSESKPNTDASRFTHSDSWYELCSFTFAYEYFYERFENNAAALEYIIHKHQRLLLNQNSGWTLDTLCEHLPCERVHEILITVRDEKEQTALFNLKHYASPQTLVKRYQNHTDELYELLSIQNVNKQTALHVNTILITRLLIYTYTPQHRDKLINLITIPDENNKTALDTTKGWVRDDLSWLIDQVEYPRYVLYGRPNVLIVYNTNDRDGAEKEAKTIYNAFQSTKLFDAKLHKDKEEKELLKLIEDSANETYLYGFLKSALIVVLLSHGSVGVINDCNGEPVSFINIESAMCQNTLQNRPKILIAQCCQVGDAVSQLDCESRLDVSLRGNPKEPYVPTKPDFCAIMSSVPGKPSEREVFIPKLAEQIVKCKKNEDIELLAKRVCQQMLLENKTQTPIIQSTLKASFCLRNRNQIHKQLFLN